MSATRSLPRPVEWASDLLAPLTRVLTGWLALVAIVLIVRSAGHSLEPLSPAMLLAAAAGFALVAWSIHTLDDRWAAGRGTLIRHVTTSISLVTIGICLTASGVQFQEALGCWALIVAEETWAWRKWGVGNGDWGMPWRQDLPPIPTVSTTMLETPTLELAPEHSPFPIPHSPLPTQRLSRTLSEDGEDRLEGWVLGTLITGQRTAHVHVAFCPPFARTPEVEFEQADGPEARVKIGQLMSYGVRFEVKLAEAGPAEVPIEFVAVYRATTANDLSDEER